MTTTISSKGQIVLPAEFRRKDELQAGEEFEIERIERGEYVLRRVTQPPNQGLIDLLLACPVKGFLEGIVNKETTDDIKPPFQ